MRPSQRLYYATVKSAVRYLEPNVPTGLTGLSTHPSPRPALLYTYAQTLSKLQQLPSHSVYRQSCEALTKQRMTIVENIKPEGHAEWLARVTKAIEASPDAYGRFKREDGTVMHQELYGADNEVWDGKISRAESRSEGAVAGEEEGAQRGKFIDKDVEITDLRAREGVALTARDLEVEPNLSADQVSEIETKIGAGLIEEVLEVAEGELLLVEEMLESRAWEDLEEKTPPGQWDYFDRGDRV